MLVNGLHEAVDLLVVEATGAGPRGDCATAATSGTHRPLEVDLQNRRSQGFFQEVLRDADKNFISFLYGSRHFKEGKSHLKLNRSQITFARQGILFFVKQVF